MAALLWYAINVSLLFASSLLCFFLIFSSKDAVAIHKRYPLLPKILFITVISTLFFDNIAMLQANIIVLTAMLAALFFYRKKKDGLAGLLFALAISIKFIPIIFLIYFAIKRELKVVASIILWMLILSLLFPSIIMGFDNASKSLLLWGEKILFKVTSIVPNRDAEDVMFSPSNQSIQAFFSRLLTGNDYPILGWKRMDHDYRPILINCNLCLGKGFAHIASKFFALFILFATLLKCFRSGSSRLSGGVNYEYALIILTSLIINPILRIEQFLLMLFPFTLAFSDIANNNEAKIDRSSYFGFITVAVLYLSQVIGICKIFSFGAISILFLWFFIYKRYCGVVNRNGLA